MRLADSFLPTAGSVGLLPMVTYFFLVVATLAFLGMFIAARVYSSSGQPTSPQRLVVALLAVAAATTGLIYYLIQLNYHDLLTELSTVSDATDRQTLIRESYNASSQYRYVAWFISAPVLLMLVIAPLRLSWKQYQKTITGLLAASLLMVFTSYIGSQQLSFDNEVQAGPKLGWGSLSVLCYGYISFTLYQLRKDTGRTVWFFRRMSLLFLASWGIYLVGYGLTLSLVDANWLHIAYALTDLLSQLSIGLISYVTWFKLPD